MKYNNEISMNLNDIKEYVKSAIIYLKHDNNLDKNEIIMYLSTVPELISDIKKDLENYMYYLNDKIDEAYGSEVNHSISNFIASLGDDYYE